jgi:hypothetical protein
LIPTRRPAGSSARCASVAAVWAGATESQRIKNDLPQGFRTKRCVVAPFCETGDLGANDRWSDRCDRMPRDVLFRCRRAAFVAPTGATAKQTEAKPLWFKELTSLRQCCAICPGATLTQHPGPTAMVQDPEDKDSGAKYWSGVDERLKAAGAARAAWMRPDRVRKDAPCEGPLEPADPPAARKAHRP